VIGLVFGSLMSGALDSPFDGFSMALVASVAMDVVCS
jgi:hypothetical protein